MDKRYRRAKGAQPTDYMKIFDALTEAADNLKEARIRIVVFIDDLDRCHPPQAVRLLDSVKLVLAQPGFIFVLALDHHILERHLDKRYRDESGLADGEHGRRYLDKIIQLPLPIPPHASRFADYIDGLLRRECLTVESNRPVAEAIKSLRDVLARGVDANPRSLIRLINNLIVDYHLWQSRVDAGLDNTRIDNALISLCAVSRLLEHALGDDLRYLAEDDALCKELHKIDGTETEGQWRSKAENLTMQPPGERLKYRVYKYREEHPAIADLLRSEPGKKWLNNGADRRKVLHFLASQRDQEQRDKRTQEQIIEAAIRKGINKPAGALTGEDLEQVRTLDLVAEPVTDAGLAHLEEMTHLRGMTNLKALWLRSPRVTDAGLAHLRKFKGLERLALTATSITDARLANLSRLDNLQYLSLRGTKVTDEGLKHLEGLKKLTLLWIGGTDVTPAGLKKLKQALPKCRTSE